MITQLRTYVRAAENLTWTTDDFEDALAEAARRMWRHIARSPSGSPVLRAYSDDTSAPGDGIVDLPADCIALESVDVLGIRAPTVYTPIPYAPPNDRAAVPPFASPFTPPAWTDDTRDGQIRLLHVRPGQSVRVMYLQEPVFPFEDAGTFRRPDAGTEDSYPNIPELCDAACEHFAAALMSGEELRDDAPIGYHGQQYSSLLSMIARGRRAAPPRLYVRHVSAIGRR
jgi:hypothetical protein